MSADRTIRRYSLFFAISLLRFLLHTSADQVFPTLTTFDQPTNIQSYEDQVWKMLSTFKTVEGSIKNYLSLALYNFTYIVEIPPLCDLAVGQIFVSFIKRFMCMLSIVIFMTFGRVLSSSAHPC